MTDRVLGVAATVGVELRRLARHRAALVVTLLLPAAVASLVAVALGDDVGDVRLAWADEEGGPVAAGFRTAITQDAELGEVVTFVEVESGAAVADAVDGGEADAGLVVPVDAVRAGVGVVAGHDPLAAGVVGTIADAIAARTSAAEVAVAHGIEPATDPALTVAVRTPGGRRLSPAVYWGPALGAFFVLLGLGYAAQRQVADRQAGVRGRAATTRAGAWPVVLGQAAAGVVVGTASLAVMALTSAVAFGQAWGPPIPLAATMVATALAVGGLSAVIAAVSRTPGQAQTATAIGAFTLAIAGGSFTTPGSASAPSGLAELLPTRVSLDAFSRTITTGAGLGELGGPLLVLLATAAAGLAVGATLDRRFAP